MLQEKEVRKILQKQRSSCDKAFEDGSDNYILHRKIIKILEVVLEIKGNERRLCVICGKTILNKRLRRDAVVKKVRTCSHDCSQKLLEKYKESVSNRSPTRRGSWSYRYGISPQEKQVLYKKYSKMGFDSSRITENLNYIDLHLKNLKREMKENNFPEEQIKDSFKREFEKLTNDKSN